MASSRASRGGTGGAQFLLMLGVAIGIIAIGVTLLFVSSPGGLKFVLVSAIVMLTLICGALLILAGTLDRRSG